jgi:hypothetical protein
MAVCANDITIEAYKAAFACPSSSPRRARRSTSHSRNEPEPLRDAESLVASDTRQRRQTLRKGERA